MITFSVCHEHDDKHDKQAEDIECEKVMVLNNFVDQVAARPPSQHSDDSELYQVDYCL